MANYSIWIDDNIGNRSSDRNATNYISLAYDRVENTYGALTLLIPATFDRRALVPDARIEVIRNSKLDTNTVWFLQDWQEIYNGPKKSDAFGNIYSNYYQLTAFDANHLLTRHAIPYAAETAYTKKTTYADDMCKAIMRENFGTLAKVPTEIPPSTLDTGRDLSTYLTIDADVSKGPSFTKSFANAKTVLEALQEVADASNQAGTELFFDIIAINAKTLLFKTYTVYRNVDRTSGNVIFSPSRGTLFDATITTQYSKEINYVYAKGQGQSTERLFVTSSDTARIAKSPLNRKEIMIDGRNSAGGTASLQSDSDAALWDGKPVVTLEATIRSNDNAVYGVDWNFGDYVPVSIGTYKFNAHIRRVSISVEAGKESIEASIVGRTL